jgi:hypothetical protein
MSFEVLMLLFEKKEKLFLKIILCVDLEYLCSHEIMLLEKESFILKLKDESQLPLRLEIMCGLELGLLF